MGKKGELNSEMVVITISAVLFVIFITCLILEGIKKGEARNEACKELGYKEYKYNIFSFCEDNKGDLYYVKYEYNKNCFFRLTTSCLDMSMKEISVGDVRVLRGT